MSVRASAGLVLLLAAAACARPSGVEPPRPIKPENGPKASIRAAFSGGAMYRELEATFLVDEAAFVMVGHLGGDGMIRVLYPESPRAIRPVEAKKQIRIPASDALYDGAPGWFSFAHQPYRITGAEQDSYDGAGHGFIFLIASRMPLNFAPVMDGNEFGELDVADYSSMIDPRLAIRRLADVVAGEDAYTLKYAAAYATTRYGAFAGGHCSGFGFSSRRGYGYRYNYGVHPFFWSAFGSPFFSWHGPDYLYGSPWMPSYLSQSRCGGMYSMFYDSRFRYRTSSMDVFPWIEPNRFGPVGPVTPTITVGGRSAIERPTIVTRLSGDPKATRPRRGSGGATAQSVNPTGTATRTNAISYNRPGWTRSIDETVRGTRSSPSYARRSSDWARHHSPARESGSSMSRPSSSGTSSSGTSSSGTTSSPSPSASSGSSGSSGSSSGAKASRPPDRAKPH